MHLRPSFGMDSRRKKPGSRMLPVRKTAERNGTIHAAAFGRMTCGAEASRACSAVTSDAAASGIRMQECFHSQARRSGCSVFADLTAEGGAKFLPADVSQRNAGGEDRSGGGGDRGCGKVAGRMRCRTFTGQCRLCRRRFRQQAAEA